MRTVWKHEAATSPSGMERHTNNVIVMLCKKPFCRGHWWGPSGWYDTITTNLKSLHASMFPTVARDLVPPTSCGKPRQKGAAIWTLRLYIARTSYKLHAGVSMSVHQKHSSGRLKVVRELVVCQRAVNELSDCPVFVGSSEA